MKSRKTSNPEGWIEAVIEIIDAEDEPLTGFIAACVERGAQGSAEQSHGIESDDEPSPGACEACGKSTRLSVYFPDSRDMEEIVNILEEANREAGGIFPGFRTRLLRCHHLGKEDWATNWQHTFPPEKVSEHFWVIPPWENPSLPDDAIPIVLEPGPAFGTGKHVTTQQCLQFLEEITAARRPSIPHSLLDAGCGSGILSIAASKLGIESVFGVDVDQDAIDVALKNLSLNTVPGRVYLANAPLESCRGEFQMIAANLTDEILLEEAERLYRQLAEDGLCLVAGILEPRIPAIAQAFQQLGLVVAAEKIDPEEGWTSLVFSKTGRL